MSLLSRIVNVFRSGRVDDDLDDELRTHLELRIEQLIAQGYPAEEARREAARRLGGAPLRIREASRDVKLLPWLESIVRDVRFGLRVLRRDGSVTGAAILSLGLAIGACAAAFSLVDALILRTLPVADPARLIYLTSDNRDAFTYPLFNRLRAAAAGRAELFLTSLENRRRAVFDATADRPEEVRLQFVSGNAFAALGVQPHIGRLLAAGDDVSPGAHPVAVLSHAFWRRRLGGDPSAVGRTFTLGDRPYQIVGIADAGFTGIEPGRLVDLWVPAMMFDAKALTAPYWHWFRILGRLQPGVAPSQVRDVLQSVVTAFQRDHAGEVLRPDSPRDRVEAFLNRRIDVHGAANGPSRLRREFERPLWILAIVAALVLLIASSNVANVFLARAAARDREIALRLSIGAGRGRLVQQLVVECAILTAAACAVGLFVASIVAPSIVRMLAPAADPVYLELGIDWRLMAFLAALGSIATILFGLAPALRASGASPAGLLSVGNLRQTSRSRLLRPLVALQVAFSLAVLFVATLLLMSFGRLAREDLGFEKDGVLLVNLEQRGQRDQGAQRGAAMQLLDNVRGLPGVEHASLAAWPLFTGGGWSGSVRIPGQPPDSYESVIMPVSTGFLETLRIPLVDGRPFEPRDAEPAQPTAVLVNEAFARRYFGDARAVGRAFHFAGDALARREVVGVTADAKYTDVRLPAPPTIYVPHAGLGTLLVRSELPPALLIPRIRGASATHPSIAIGSVSLQATLVDDTLLRERLLARLSAFFAIVGLLLAAVGLYGVLSYSVVQRTRELGIRVAMGASPRSLVYSIVREAAVMTILGLAAGLAAGLYFSGFVKTLLFEVEPLQAWSLAIPIASLLTTAVAAAAWPAWRAVRADPLVALRHE